jgi:toxin ParE1/3/4
VDYRLVYTQKALNDLAGIIEGIARDSADAASRVGSALLDHVELLTHFPRMGSAIRKRRGVRKLVHSPFTVYYQVHETRRVIELLHFRHGARKPPKSFG